MSAVAVVTGAGRGFGRAIAQALAASGTRVVAVDFPEREAENRATAEAITFAGGAGLAVSADISTMDGGTEALSAAMDAHGQLDILICAQQEPRPGSILDISVEDFDTEMARTLKATFTCVRLASVIMRQQRSGRMILATSGLGLSRLASSEGLVSSATATAGVAGIVRVVSKDLARYGVAVNGLDLDAVTDAHDRGSPWTTSGEVVGTFEDALALPLYLALDAAGTQITGETFLVSRERIGVYHRYRQDIVASRPGGWDMDQVQEYFGTLDAIERLSAMAPSPSEASAALS